MIFNIIYFFIKKLKKLIVDIYYYTLYISFTIKKINK